MMKTPPSGAADEDLRDWKGRSLLVVSNVFPPQIIGGAEIVAHRQALAFKDLGFDVAVVTLLNTWDAGDRPGLTIDEVNGLRVFRILAKPLGLDRNYCRPEIEPYFHSVLRLVRPDIVHFHNLPGLGAGLIPVARASGARVIVTLHDTWGFCLRQTLMRDGLKMCANFTECDVCMPSVPGLVGERVPVRLRRDYVRWCLEHAHRLVSPSAAMRHYYEAAGFPAALFELVSNGSDLAAFVPRQRKPGRQVSFLFAGTLAEHKGVRSLFEALEILLSDEALAGRWEFVLGGEGPLASDLRSRLEQGKLRPPVQSAGFIKREAIAAAYDHADVVVIPSIVPENEPVTLLEAIASGAAQIGARIGGIPELIDEERSGFLVPPGDAAALAAAMRRMIIEPRLVEAFSAYNLQRREAFDERKSIMRLARIFTSPADSCPEQRRTGATAEAPR
jgi:glycosyltransferase involved in cell wall biosynthesis